MSCFDSLPETPFECELLLNEARELFELLKDREARHVSRALRDARFEGRRFSRAQEGLALLRREFAERVRGLLPQFAEAPRRELLTLAILAEQAPLTTDDDVEAIRRGRIRSSA